MLIAIFIFRNSRLFIIRWHETVNLLQGW